MPADDPVSAALAPIREHGYKPDQSGAAAFRQSDNAARDVPRLLAALDAVLKLADKYDAESKRLWGQVRDADRRGVMTGSKSIDAAWNGDVAKAIREVIARELTGEKSGA